MKLSTAIYKFIIRLYRLLPGKIYFCKALKMAKMPTSKIYKDLKFEGVFNVPVDLHSSFVLYHYGGTIENETFWNGLFNTFENDSGWIWKELCTFSNVILDIGANTGIYSLTAKAINPSATVIAFEPSHHTYYKLVRNNALNKYDIICEQIALSDSNGCSTFYDTVDSNQTGASLSRDGLRSWDKFDGVIKEYEVNTQTLKSYIIQKNIQKIDLIKIDVETFEPQVMNGYAELFLEHKPIILLEVLTKEVAEQLDTIMDSNNFFKYHLTGENEMIKVDKFEIIPYSYRWNYLVCHKDCLGKIERLITLPS